MFISSFLLPLLTVTTLVSAAGHGHGVRRHHAKLANRGNATEVEEGALTKRGPSFSGVATWYDTGVGACGQHSNPGDFMVALNSAQYGGGYPGPQCFKWITVSHNGQQRQAQVLDECPTCAYGFLDFSPGLFDSFGLGDRHDVGVMDITWWFNDNAPSQPQPSSAAPPPPPSSTWQAPSSTWSPPPPPSSTSEWVAPSSTSTWVPPSSTSTVASSSISSVVSSSDISSSTSLVSSSVSSSASSLVASASASASVVIPKPQEIASTNNHDQQAVFNGENIVNLNVLTAQFGGLVVVAARST